MSTSKRKPRTPSPLDEVTLEDLAQEFSSDFFAGRPVSVSEFDGQDFLDGENVASPGACSTSSEPVYSRQPGFQYHAHEILAPSYTNNSQEGNFQNQSGFPYNGLNQVNVSNPSNLAPENIHQSQFNIQNQTQIQNASEFAGNSSFIHQPSYDQQIGYNNYGPCDAVASTTQHDSSYPFPNEQQVIEQPNTTIPESPHPTQISHMYPVQREIPSRVSSTPESVCRSSQKGAKKKKKANTDDTSDLTTTTVLEKKLNGPSNKQKTRHRVPLPMKMRALPQSFWVQPNRRNNVPPSGGSILPPLILGKDPQDLIELPTEVSIEETLISSTVSKYAVSSMSPSPTLSNHSVLNLNHTTPVPPLSSQPSSTSLNTQPPAGLSLSASPSSSSLTALLNSKDPTHKTPILKETSPLGVKKIPVGGSSPTPTFTPLERKGERIIKVGNTDLLFRLFDKVEQHEKKKLTFIRRGRPKKASSSGHRKASREEDPCLLGAVTDGMLPLLGDGATPTASGTSSPLDTRLAGTQVLEMVSLRDGDRTISLPSLSVEHNYNQVLSELVMKL